MAGVRERNPRWAGERTNYNAAHLWAKNHFDDPLLCAHCGEKGRNRRDDSDLPVLHWAAVHGRHEGGYSRNQEDWLRLCVSCHWKYDQSDQLDPDEMSRRGALGAKARWG